MTAIKLTIIKNDVELKPAQVEAIKRAFTTEAAAAHIAGKNITLEYTQAHGYVHVVLFETIDHVDHKFKIMERFVGERGGLTLV